LFLVPALAAGACGLLPGVRRGRPAAVVTAAIAPAVVAALLWFPVLVPLYLGTGVLGLPIESGLLALLFTAAAPLFPGPGGAPFGRARPLSPGGGGAGAPGGAVGGPRAPLHVRIAAAAQRPVRPGRRIRPRPLAGRRRPAGPGAARARRAVRRAGGSVP